MNALAKIILVVAFLSGLTSKAFAQLHVWGKAIGGSASETSRAIATDVHGNTYITGIFFGTTDFDPSSSTQNLTSVGLGDIFVAKYNVPGGLVWAKAIGGTMNDQGFSIAVDTSGNVYTAGIFRDAVDFDPGSSVNSVNSAGITDVFVLKLNSAGNFVWVKSFGSAGDDLSESISLDAAGNCYVTGGFSNTVDFDPGPGIMNLTSAGGQDIFVAKLSPAGALVWAKSMGGISNDWAHAVAVDKFGGVYTVGEFDTTADFDPGPATVTLFASTNQYVFLSKLDTSGNFVWAKSLSSASHLYAGCLASDPTGNVYIAGSFYGTMDFDPGMAQYNLTATTPDNGFVLKTDGNGNFMWAKSFSGNAGSTNECSSIAVDDSINVYITGSFAGTTDFNPASATINLTAVGNTDVFISKLDGLGSFVWARQIGGTQQDIAVGLVVDSLHNVCLTGSFVGAFDAEQGNGVYTLTSSGSTDIFIERLAQCTMSFLINEGSSTLNAPGYFLSYQWYKNDTAITYATNSSYTMHKRVATMSLLKIPMAAWVNPI